ncbi:hypothetical protein [Actibacterium lipolyticum]|uniref:Sulfotransferase family protein n=1 Tax=Actibacterium lipolyticum TaxID=1524263 RepID=A0A238KLP7_9RHOB|nr:hypothetical protein [Actibacterium lipolyticum]SMX43683.1 hypothetical protein COL8621_02361 [Actibacterium lipolyticum]
MSRKTIYLHMGLHKTGTTSIQNWLLSNSDALLKTDLAFYQGRYIPSNHIEFALSSLRDELDAPIKRRVDLDRERLFEETKAQLELFLSKTRASRLIISNETISFIRDKTEMKRLRSIFPPNAAIVPIIFLRSKEEWLASFKQQMFKMGLKESTDPKSCTYFGSDTWLLQHETLVDLVRRTFGEVKTVQYDGASLRQLFSTIGADIDVEEPMLNVTRKTKTLRD